MALGFDKWRVDWYRRRWRVARAWYAALFGPDPDRLAPVLSEPCARPDSCYWRESEDARRALLTAADRLLAGKYTLLSAGEVWIGDRQAWATHPLTRRPLPSYLHPFDWGSHPSTAGTDQALVLYLHTLPFLPLLAQAFRLTRNPAYREQLERLLDFFIQENWPVRSGSWCDGLHIALHAISLLYTLSLLGPDDTPRSLARTVARVVGTSGRLLDALAEQVSFNHRVIEAYGLFCCGLACRDLPAGPRWIQKGTAILRHELNRQFFPDGMHGERSPSYLRFVLEAYLFFRVLAVRHGLDPGEDFDRRLQKACETLAGLVCADGRLPAFGDDSEYSVLTADRTGEVCLAIAAALWQRGDLKAGRNRFPPAALWLLGEEGYQTFRQLPEAPASARSLCWPDAGFYVLRNQHGALRITAGRELTPRHGHSHADLLSFELEVAGDRPLVDAGTYLYLVNFPWRNYFRGSRAHNTGVVDGQDQGVPLPNDHFGWSSYPHPRVRQWREDEEADLFDAEHDGYGRLPQPVVHRRRVLGLKPDYWLLIDDFLGEGEHTCELFFQFAPGVVQLVSAQQAIARRPWGDLVVWQLAENCQVDLAAGQREPIRGWVSFGYGDLREAPSLRFARRGALPIRFCTLLLPNVHHEPVQAWRSLELETPQAAESIHVHYGRQRDSIRLLGGRDGEPEGLLIQRNGRELRL